MNYLEIIKSMRPQQWIKNLFIFAAILFSKNIFNPNMFLKTISAFFIFCFISGSLYIFNDIIDSDVDKLHTIKSKRPIPSGRLKKSQAFLFFVIVSISSLVLALILNKNFFIVSLIYFILQIGYSLYFKHVIILDVFIIAANFLIRVIAGAVVIEVYISPWLIICTMLLSLFLAMSKRRHEIVLLGENAANHRVILAKYSPYLLDQMISVVTSSTVIVYCLYTISAETVAKVGTINLIYTVPFVLYGILRYLYLVHQKLEGGSPENLILKDKALLLNIILWGISVILIVY
ncbi:MAG: decaprenyl-phosphate phosphoribosyltransferase [Candidatus Aminicenantes bacterium]|nr:decaprenyl-phosphate phosphoribosyltransferase [Candidatus Aminicenantes bacterium]